MNRNTGTPAEATAIGGGTSEDPLTIPVRIDKARQPLDILVYRVLVSQAKAARASMAPRCDLAHTAAESSVHVSTSGRPRARTLHFICGWLCLTQKRPAPTGKRRTEVGLPLQHC